MVNLYLNSGSLNDNDISEVAKFMAAGDIAAFSAMTQSCFNVHKIIAKIRKINSTVKISFVELYPPI